MAKAKFTYDENGATYYFILSFLGLILLPSTYYFWSSKGTCSDDYDTNKSGKKCNCNGCLNKRKLNSKESKKKKSRQLFLRTLIVLGWLLFLAIVYRVNTLENEYINWDPYEILGVEDNASPEVVKKAYRKLSLIYHPDKFSGNSDTFVQITKAYATLTDETARKNWQEYGHPEGPRAASFGIALPSWIVEKENSFIVLGIYALIFMVALPVSVGLWWYKSVKFGSEQVLLSTTELFYYFIHKTPHMNLKRVIMIVSASFEYSKTHNSEVIERESDNIEVPRLMRELNNLSEKNKERPLCYSYSIKTRAILHAHLSRLKLSSSALEVDRIFIVQKCPTLIQEFVSCVSQLITLAITGRIQNKPALVTLENSMKLSPLVVQAMWEFQSPLLQIPHFTEDTIKTLTKKNIKSIEQIAKLEEKQRRDILHNFNEKQLEDIENVVSSLPSIKVDAKFEVLDDEDPHIITSGAIVTVTVNLRRFRLGDISTKTEESIPQKASKVEENNNNEDENENIHSRKPKVFESKPRLSHTVHCPYFPDNKQEFWWVYVVDRKRLLLITAPLLVTNLVDSEEVELKFTAPTKPQMYSYTIVVRSDSYLDCNAQKTFQIDVKPAKQIDPGQMWDISDDEPEIEDYDDSAVEDSDLATDTD